MDLSLFVSHFGYILITFFAGVFSGFLLSKGGFNLFKKRK